MNPTPLSGPGGASSLLSLVALLLALVTSTARGTSSGGSTTDVKYAVGDVLTFVM